jgi:hypothetical protein
MGPNRGSVAMDSVFLSLLAKAGLNLPILEIIEVLCQTKGERLEHRRVHFLKLYVHQATGIQHGSVRQRS